MKQQYEEVRKPLHLDDKQKARYKELERLSALTQKAVQLEGMGRLADAVALYEQCAASGCTTSMAALGRIFHCDPATKDPDFIRGVY